MRSVSLTLITCVEVNRLLADTVKGQFMKFTLIWILGVSLLAFAPPRACAQDAPVGEATKLTDLLSEAEKNNPQIQAARHRWQSAKNARMGFTSNPSVNSQRSDFIRSCRS